MTTLSLYSDSIEGRYIAKTVQALRDGAIIIYPTDTVYALGCDALNHRAVRNLCQIKQLNPDKNILSIVCASLSMAAEYARIDNRAFRIVKDIVPAPVTFILPASTKLPKTFKGRKNVGVRIPDNPIARALAENLGNPLLTSSVDPSDPTDPESIASPALIAEKYDDIAAILIDSGVGGTISSTIVDITKSDEPRIIRQGVAQINF